MKNFYYDFTEECKMQSESTGISFCNQAEILLGKISTYGISK